MYIKFIVVGLRCRTHNDRFLGPWRGNSTLKETITILSLSALVFPTNKHLRSFTGVYEPYNFEVCLWSLNGFFVRRITILYFGRVYSHSSDLIVYQLVSGLENVGKGAC